MKTSCRYAHGSTPKRWHVEVTLKSTAAVWPPRGDPTVNQFLRLCGAPHNRKNWLFAGSFKGAETAAILFSVTSSCHRHKVDAFAYLHDLLQRLAHDPEPAPEVLRDWLPDRWKPPPAQSPDAP